MIIAGHIHTELGEVIAGTKPGRTNDEQITLYKSVGVAVQDAAGAALSDALAATKVDAGVRAPSSARPLAVRHTARIARRASETATCGCPLGRVVDQPLECVRPVPAHRLARFAVGQMLVMDGKRCAHLRRQHAQLQRCRRDPRRRPIGRAQNLAPSFRAYGADSLVAVKQRA